MLISLAPASESVNQGLDDVVVVWSSTNCPHNRLFMIDCNPDPSNLSCLASTNEDTSKPSTDYVKKGGENREEDPNYLPFSKQRVKLPKAHNVSKKIVMKKQKAKIRMRNLRNQAATFPATQTIPVICNLRVTAGLCAPDEASTSEATTSEPYKSSDLPSMVSSAGPPEPEPSNRLREIIIDGNNIAMAYDDRSFSLIITNLCITVIHMV